MTTLVPGFMTLWGRGNRRSRRRLQGWRSARRFTARTRASSVVAKKSGGPNNNSGTGVKKPAPRSLLQPFCRSRNTWSHVPVFPKSTQQDITRYYYIIRFFVLHVRNERRKRVGTILDAKPPPVQTTKTTKSKYFLLPNLKSKPPPKHRQNQQNQSVRERRLSIFGILHK